VLKNLKLRSEDDNASTSNNKELEKKETAAPKRIPITVSVSKVKKNSTIEDQEETIQIEQDFVSEAI
jgi:hypothetical protein